MAATVGGAGKAGAAGEEGTAAPSSVETSLGVQQLVQLINERIIVPVRAAEGAFLFAIDHCFPIKGQVCTGGI